MQENKYCDTYDTYYDTGGEWLEKKCGDPDCYFCPHRPVKHSPHCRCLKDYEPNAGLEYRD